MARRPPSPVALTRSGHPPRVRGPDRPADAIDRVGRIRTSREERDRVPTPPPMPPDAIDGRRRVVIEGIVPTVDDGRFPVKRVLGDRLVIEADVFGDGHDLVVATLRHRPPGADGWHEIPMTSIYNDRWRAEVELSALGRHAYTIAGHIDHFGTWRHDLDKRLAAEQDVTVDLRIGARLVAEAAERAGGADARRLTRLARTLEGGGRRAVAAATSDDLAELMARHPDRRHETQREPPLEVEVEAVIARFSTWYELFPRSTSTEEGRHGTFRDVIARLPYVAELGFDVLYLPPIHPIGAAHRKGPNNATEAGPGDPGVPWAIGAATGGHTEVHPDLGTLEDFEALVRAAADRGIRIALDLAFQASPDHPYVRDHAGWFRARPDGTIQYAENPPKKYQDIYPFDFESEDWPALWSALLGIVRTWIDRGVRIFRVDNPHTKPFAFWEWLISEVRRTDPDIVFLAEAFTRPKVMYRLGKLGFSQSYTYFTWRTSKAELIDYFTELSRPPVSDRFRPSVWPNTPDILHETLQVGGRPTSIARVTLAATLASSYGIYGPVFELLETTPREPGSEEYLDSEKYQLRTWDLEREDSLAPIIGRLNAIRRAHPALQANEHLAFHDIDDDQIIAYTKRTADGSDVVLAVVNLDPHRTRSGWLELPLEELGLDPDRPFEAHDELADTTYRWQGPRNWVELDPETLPVHVFHLRPEPRSERDFEGYR
jgi:starch synthase (maltosyl-transferring)